MPGYCRMWKLYRGDILTACCGRAASSLGIRTMTYCVFILLFFVHRGGSDADDEGEDGHGEGLLQT